jgi:PX-associated
MADSELVIPTGEQATRGAASHADDTTLTPLRTHYLKKTLVSLQFTNELSELTQPASSSSTSSLSYLGQPFTPPPKGAPVLDFPFIRYMFRQFVLTFPFLAAAPKDFFPQKVQPFLASLLSRNLSAASPFDEDVEQTEQATREKILSRIQKQFSLILGSATKLIEPEEVVRLSQRDLERLETLARRRQARDSKFRDTFDVNIVSVRTIVDKGRVRSRVHEVLVRE